MSLFSIRMAIACALVASLSSLAWSQSRHIDVVAVDEHERPLTEAIVMVSIVPEPPEFPGDQIQLGERTAVAYVFAKTDASGSAHVDVASLNAVAPDQPLRVMVWKKGYGPQLATAHNQAKIRCYPVIKRSFQIVDAARRPVAGVKVQHLTGEIVADSDLAKMAWWTDDDPRTNEFGVVALDAHANGSAWFEIATTEGVRHQVKLSNNLSNSEKSDPRDLVEVRLSRYGKLEGQLSPEFVRDYQVRLITPIGMARKPLDKGTHFDLSVNLRSDGRFTVDAIPEGTYWLVVRPQPARISAELFQSGKAPQAMLEVRVVADQTVPVSVRTVSLAKVTGRLVSKTSSHDYSGAQVNVLQALPGEPPFPQPKPPFGRTQCQADGSFEYWLPAGQYELACAVDSHWRADKPLSLEVGAGAATISAGQLKASPTKPVKVAWQSKYRMPNYVANHSDYRIVFSFKDNQRVLCNLTQDGHGRIFVPAGEEAAGIHHNINNTINPRPRCASAFVDVDPTDNYQLELVSKPQGLASNISLRGRVLDRLGNGVANVPVEIALDHRTSTSTGMKSLEHVKTEADGSFLIPPRQLLGDVSQASPSESIEGTFNFSAFVHANPEPVQVRKVIGLNSQAWELTEIEFADIVVDPQLLNQRLSAQLLDAHGQPATGEFNQLADQRRLIGVISDANGRIAIDNLTGPTWLLRSSDWSIHKIDSYDQPLTIAFDAKATGSAGAAVQLRMPKEKRLDLARKILESVPKLGTPTNPVPDAYQPLSDEAYLSPDKAWQQILTAGDPAGDVQRLQYARFWSGLDDARLEQLVAAMKTDVARMQLLRVMADRKPSPEAYVRVLEAVPIRPQASIYFFLSQEAIFEQVAEAGLKLHNLGQLEPHRDKIRSYVEQWAAVRTDPKFKGKPRLTMTNYERLHGPVCLALADPEKFARETLDLLSMDVAQLTNEERNTQSLHARVFLQLFPNEHGKLPPQPLRLARDEQVLISWGEQSPLTALDEIKRGQLHATQLRVVAEAALLSHHPDAEQMVREANMVLVRQETPAAGFTDGYSEIEVYRAARSTAPDLARQMAWFMARDYLSGRYEFNGPDILPTQDQMANRTLAVAYCLAEQYTHLSEQIVRLGVPRVLKNLDRQFDEQYAETMNMMLVAWFDPQAACDLLVELSQRYAEDVQKQNAQPAPQGQPFAQPNSAEIRMLNMTRNLALLRHTCLQGLLLDEPTAANR